ncbi:Rhomboid protease GlpG [Anatilimnocola aggregata]|uniref:Rhomboid protease GlpG n=1 Tax=Anatilimnocola aggregata TaxID=2528021 RepID=A0A517YKK3_9BACT|nr:rhomboid family intramembrane serine protease [Anatilimnocola aggregata]QDU30748.1 Rhomboid protease GlpG [Anatilimnocola aggregata]
MRQLTTFKDEATAQRFAAWLVTQKIESHAEKEGEQWAVWVREEDQLAKAKTELAAYQAEPNSARYQGAERQAAALRLEEQKKRDQAQKNLIEMSGKWGKGMAQTRSSPITLAMIAACVLVAVLTSLGESRDPRILGTLQFSGGRLAAVQDADGELRMPVVPVWQSVKSGEVWRLVTPIFIHFGIMHLVFNLMWLYDLGGQAESIMKSGRFILFVLIVAVISNITEVFTGSFLNRPFFPAAGNFGGMSGVNYGLFGFIYIRSAVLHRGNYMLRPGTALMMFLWLFFCIGRDFMSADFAGGMSYVANGAHVGGLLIGMALAYVPKLFDPPGQ